MGKGKRRLKKILLIGLGGLVLLVLLAVTGVWLVVANVDSDFVKTRLIRQIKAATAMDVDFRQMRIHPFSGISIRGLVVRNPRPLDAYAKDLLRVKDIVITWDFGSLNTKKRAFAIDIDEPVVNLVQGADGRTAFDILFGPPKPSKKKPLSQTLRLGDLGVWLKHMNVKGIKVTVIRVKQGGKLDRAQLAGLDISGNALIAGGKQQASFLAGSLDSRAIDIAAMGKKLRIPLKLKIDLKGQALAVNLDLGVLEQNILAMKGWKGLLPDGRLLEVDLGLGFQPEQHRVQVDLRKLTLANVIRASARVMLPDQPKQDAIAFADAFKLSMDTNPQVEAMISRMVKGVTLHGLHADVGTKKAALQVLPPFIRFSEPARINAAIKGISAEHSGVKAVLKDLGLVINVKQEKQGVKTNLTLKINHLQADKGPMHVAVEGLKTGLDLPVVDDAFKWVGSSANAVLSCADVKFRREKTRATTKGILLKASLPVDIKQAFATKANLDVKGIGLDMPGMKQAPFDVNMTMALDKVRFDPKHPKAVSGVLHAGLRLLDMKVGLNATKQAGQVNMQALLSMAHMGMIRRFMKKMPIKLPLDSMALKVAMNVDADRVFGTKPRIKAGLDADLTGLKLRQKGLRLGLPQVTLEGRAQLPKGFGNVKVQANMEMRNISMNNRRVLDRVTFDLDAKRAGKLTADMKIDTALARVRPLSARIKVTTDKGIRYLAWDAGIVAKNINKFQRFMPKNLKKMLRLNTLVMKLDSKGTIYPLNRLKYLKSIHLTQKTGLKVLGIHVESGDAKIDIPMVTAKLDATAKNNRAKANLVMESKVITAAKGAQKYRINGLAFMVNGRAKGLGKKGSLGITALAGFRDLDWAMSKKIPIQGFSIGLETTLGRDATVDKFVIKNKGTGTVLELQGVMAGLMGYKKMQNLGRRKTLYITGRLKEDLAKFSGSILHGRGSLSVPFKIESLDQGLFRISMNMDAKSVDIHAKGLDVEGLNGRIPIVEEFIANKKGVRLITGKAANLYSLVRYIDMHPFLASKAYLAVKKVNAGPLSIGPLAGNMRVLRNVFSLDQLQARWRHGNVAGQLVVQYNPKDPRMYFRGRLTGVRPTAGSQTLDANAAIYVSIGTQEVSGRMHIIRIGRQHLLDALDVADPYHEDIGINRIRKLLGLAYPKYVRVRMDQGFLSAKIALGGLGSLVNIQEIRGIPTGPIIRKALSMFSTGGEK